VLDHHLVEPVGIVVTGIREAGEYGYESYRGEQPTLEADITAVAGTSARGPERPAQREQTRGSSRERQHQ
jgi:hypothetical protein